jgi:dihydrofolate reductase
MTKVVVIMSMSLDGYVADANDGVAEVFAWCFSGDVQVSTASETMDMTFHVSPPSADHLRALGAEVGAMLVGRRTFEVADGWGGQHPWDVPGFVVTHQVPEGWPRPGSTIEFVTDGIESAVARARSAAGPKSVECTAPRRSSSAWTPGCSTRSASTWLPCCSAQECGCSTIS